MILRCLLLIFLLAMTCSRSAAQMKLGATTSIVFATVEQANEVLTSRDDFVRRMSPFDRSARLKTGSEVSEEDYLKFVSKSALTWDDAERKKITAAFQGIQKELETLDLPFPEKVLIVKTTGDEEGGAAYTRANAIVFPAVFLKSPIARIRKTLSHELFHVLSRANPKLREKLYAVIGFEQCDEVAFPKELKSRKITNPDAPKNNHFIRLQIADEEHCAIPILFSSTEKYDPKRGGEFFTYLQFQLLLVEQSGDSTTVTPIYEGQEPKLVSVQRVSGFFEQVGKNTGYIIHPEEILADNFALLILKSSNLRSPEIIAKMKAVLRDNK